MSMTANMLMDATTPPEYLGRVRANPVFKDMSNTYPNDIVEVEIGGQKFTRLTTVSSGSNGPLFVNDVSAKIVGDRMIVILITASDLDTVETILSGFKKY